MTIPDNVTSVGEGAFEGCSGLTSVTIGNGLTSIGEMVFQGCSSLTSVTIPCSVASIGASAFAGCSGLASVTIPDNVTSVGEGAFEGCSGLTSVTIGNGVESIGDGAFSGCSGLTSVTIPQTGVDRFQSTFNGYSNLSLIIAEGVTSIGSSAFCCCTGLMNVTIPDSVTSIGEDAFSTCSGLTILTIGNGVTNIGSYAFYNCTGLENVLIGDSVTSVGVSAFAGCVGLTSVTIPTSVANIGNDAFDGCSKLMDVYVDDVASWCEIGFGNYYSNPLVYANKFYMNGRLVTNLEIPSSVTSIGAYAFCECSGLTSVMIPSSVTNTGSYAFAGCVGLTSVMIPDSVAIIGDGAFSGCSGLESVLIGNSVTSVGTSAFAGCGELTSIALPDSVMSIGDGAFSGCSGLEKISLPFVGSCRGNSGNANALLGYIFGTSSYAGGTGTKQYYSSSSYSTFYIPSALRRVIITDESSFGYGAFSYCRGLTNITFGSSLTSIGPAAFRSCGGLTSMTIPSSVTSIGNQAFDGCSKLANVYVDDVAAWCKISFGNYYSNPLVYANKFYLDGRVVTNLEIPNSVTSIGAYAFCKCSGLTRVTIPDTVTRIGAYAFRNCTGLTSMTIPNSVTIIGNDAFYSCSKLVSVEIGDSVTSIGANAFENCGKLASVTIPGLVTYIGSSTFSNCGGLTNVVFRGDAPTMGSGAFNNVDTDCCVYVRRASSGWGVEIPGMWQSMLIDYVRRNVAFDANDGSCIVTNICVADGGEIGELPTPTRWGYAFKGWWTAQDGGEEVAGATIIENDKTLYAHWEQYVVDVPVVVPSDGSVFYGDSCEVTITCATDGAMIYYSDNEVLPEIEDGYLYNAPFVISDTTVIKAVAVFEGVKSDCVTVTITKEDKSLNVVLDAPDAVTIVSDPAVAWQPVVDEAAKIGGSSARSGAIGDRASTWLSATVEGAGTMTFWCKTSCEHDEDNMFTWDRLMIYTNDVEIAEWRMDGETDWTERTLSFEGGVNTVKWVYYKDRTGADGEDCAWVDAVTWTPSEAADPIPAVAVDADAATVNAAVDGAGFVDAAVKVTIGGSATEYNAFKTWADGVKGVTGDALAGEAAVVANAHAAAAYLLGAERLFENEPTVEIGELAIVDGESAGTTAMTVAVTVKDGESAVAVDAAKVAAMFEATGDLGDWTGAAKLTPMVTNSGTDASGKMTFVVIPGDGTATKAFFRIRK